MAETMTFDSLKSDLERYLERGDSATTDVDFQAQLPRMINLAERRISRELKVQGFIEAVTTTLTIAQSVYDKPDRWRETISVNIGTGTSNATRTPLFARGYEYVRAYWPSEAVTDTPEFYADYDATHWLIAPTPDAAYPMEVLYYAQPPLLDDSNQTNWLTDYAPQLLLYAALLEAEPFLKNDERIGTWQALYDRAAAMLNGEDLAKIFDRNSARKES